MQILAIFQSINENRALYRCVNNKVNIKVNRITTSSRNISWTDDEQMVSLGEITLCVASQR